MASRGALFVSLTRFEEVVCLLLSDNPVYKVRHQEGYEVEMDVPPSLMQKVNTGDAGAIKSLCIRVRETFKAEYREFQPQWVDMRDFTLELL